MTRLNLTLLEQLWNLEAAGLVTSEGFQTYLRSIASTSPGWINDNGVISLKPLTSNGRTGREWMDLFEMMQVSILEGGAGNFFNCFNPSEGTGYPISILTPNLFPPELPITTKQVFAKANMLGLSIPAERSVIGEIMFLLSTFLSFQKMSDMGLDSIGILHQNRHQYQNDGHYLLCFEVEGPDHYRRKQLAVYCSGLGNKWYRNRRIGFVFLR